MVLTLHFTCQIYFKPISNQDQIGSGDFGEDRQNGGGSENNDRTIASKDYQKESQGEQTHLPSLEKFD